VVSFMHRPLHSRRRKPQYPVDRIWVGPRADLNAGARRKTFNHHRESDPGRPAHHIAEKFSNNLPGFWGDIYCVRSTAAPYSSAFHIWITLLWLQITCTVGVLLYQDRQKLTYTYEIYVHPWISNLTKILQ